MHQPDQNGRAHCVVAQVFAPILDHPVRSDHDGAAQHVAPVHHGLQQFGAGIGHAPGNEHVVEDQQFGLKAARPTRWPSTSGARTRALWAPAHSARVARLREITKKLQAVLC